MKVKDLSDEQIVPGMKFRNPKNGHVSEVISVNPKDSEFSVDLKHPNGKESWGVFILWIGEWEVVDCPCSSED